MLAESAVKDIAAVLASQPALWKKKKWQISKINLSICPAISSTGLTVFQARRTTLPPSKKTLTQRNRKDRRPSNLSFSDI